MEGELMRIAAKVELSEAQRKQLETWATARTIPVRLAERAKMILLAAEGKTDKESKPYGSTKRRNAVATRQRVCLS